MHEHPYHEDPYTRTEVVVEYAQVNTKITGHMSFQTSFTSTGHPERNSCNPNNPSNITLTRSDRSSHVERQNCRRQPLHLRSISCHQFEYSYHKQTTRWGDISTKDMFERNKELDSNRYSVTTLERTLKRLE